MAADGQSKQPGEILQMGADFAQSLLPGEAIVGGNVAISVVNGLTDVVVTGSILVGGSTAVATTIITGRFQAGTDGDVYFITFDTGSTNLGNRYKATASLTITTVPEGDNLFCNLAEVKRLIGIDTTDTSSDVILGDLIQNSTKYLSNRIGRDLLFKTYTERVYVSDSDLGEYDGGGSWESSCVLLRNFPVRKIDSIVLTSMDTTLVQTITDATSYDFTSDGRLFFRHTYFFYDYPDYNVITYRAGYDRIPNDLREAAKRLVALLYRWRGREGLQSERLGDYSWSAKVSNPASGVLKQELEDGFIEGVVSRYRRLDLSL